MYTEVIKYYIDKYKYYLIVVVLIIIAALFLFKNNNEGIIEEISLNKNEVQEVLDIIKIEIKGAVNSPGVYELPTNSRVIDGINISGGLTSDADISTVNLSKKLDDEVVVIIYTKDEIKELKKGSTSVKYIENECICPQIKNDACIENKITNIEIYENKSKSDKININTADIKELIKLNGIGESKAKAIIEYRNINGAFKSVEDIKKVSGIGNTTYEKIKDSITV